jgi:hypothetical protein
VTKKCQGSDAYPGLVLHSEVQMADGRCGLKPFGQGDHRIVVTNASPLTYVVTGHSTCEKDYLEYPDVDKASPNIWDTTFTAPWRWNGKPRTSKDQVRIAAKASVRPTPDREVTVEITCQAAGCVAVGPFTIPLQVDIEAV